MSLDNLLLQLLDEHGEDAGSDFNDGVDGFFGWKLFYQGDNLCITITLEDCNTVTKQTWILTPL